MPKHLPFNPSIENLKKQAKQLVKDHKAGQVDAFTRIKTSFPRLAHASVHEILDAEFSLCNAQLVVAREYGFATWKEMVEAVTMPESSSFDDVLVSDNPSLRWVQPMVTQAAATQLPVLISGETGTGKGVVARTIHRLSARKNSPFIQVNCSASPDILVESDLFGHEEGAFTGAHARKPGKIEVARGGTLFLDEIGDLGLSTQAKLLRLLEDYTFERIGGSEMLEADVRVVAATGWNLEELVEAGVFRQDLAYLLLKLPLQLPPLRERREDIPLLATHFMEKMAANLDKAVPGLSPEALRALQDHEWPGNVRELENRVQRAVAICPEPSIRREDIALD